MLMGLWWGGDWWVLVLFWDFHSETEACLLGAGRGLGLAGAFITWEVTLIDMDSNKILCYVCFSFSENCVQS